MLKYIPVAFAVFALGVVAALDFMGFKSRSVEIAHLQEGATMIDADFEVPEVSYTDHLLSLIGLADGLPDPSLESARIERKVLRAAALNSYFPTPSEEILPGWERISWSDDFHTGFGWPDGMADGKPSKYAPKLDEDIAIYLNGRKETATAIAPYMSEGTLDLLKKVKKTGVARLRRMFAEQPQCLQHGDYRPDNMFFHEDGRLASVIDWQGTNVGPAIFDVLYFLLSSIEVDDPDAHVDDLMRVYHDELVANGVDDYPFEQMMEHYEEMLLIFVHGMPLLVANVDFGDGRGVGAACGHDGAAQRANERGGGWRRRRRRHEPRKGRCISRRRAREKHQRWR